MTWLEILQMFGLPSMLVALVVYVVKAVLAMKKGLQALLRSQLITDYNRQHDKGFAPIYARENFENCWKQYHNLGANGVMDGVREQFMDLPVSKEN